MHTVISDTRRLLVFLSSTYTDLDLHRAKVEEALTRAEAGFRSMKFFGSKEGDPLDLCLSKVRQCNYYIGIIGHRYGTVHKSLGKSFTELEYEEAKRCRLPRKIYTASSSMPIQASQMESDEKRAQLESFKQRLKKENTVVEFSSPEDLAIKVLADILMAHPESTQFTEFAETKYLPAIRRTCASISFLGLDIQMMKRHRDVRLEKVYVQSRFSYLPEARELSSKERQAARTLLKTGGRQTTEEVFGLSDVLRENANVVILGDPGSGKTTLVKFIVVAIVDRLSDVTHLGAGIPIRIPLRTYADYRQRAGGVGVSILDFVKELARTELQLDALPENFFEFYLERRQAVVIFDGMDEIFDIHLREQVRNDIVAFTQVAFQGNRVLISSRKTGYDETAFPQPDFTHFAVLPFNDEQISEYIDKWYRLEEPDQAKRKAELNALEAARKKLPEELVSNPLLLSLIVILFRSGCTLPDSKLEIYRCCVGTLTEKWDAAGKRLELPPEYNLIRDKKGAFARIAYWMYKELSGPRVAQGRPSYSEILVELTRHLSDREFRGREPEADRAAQHFLEYAAKRSIFVQDSFVHKTFHEYFSALYLYRNFCVGHTPDELYSEIKPYLASDYWSVVLELLFLMTDEHSGAVVDSILERVIAEVKSSPSQNSILLASPLRLLTELQNVGAGTAASLISLAVEMCAAIRVPSLWLEERACT